MSGADFDDEEEPGFFKKYRVPIILGVVVALGAGAWALMPKEKPKKRTASVSMVNIMPPPPPTPPPPTPPPTPPPEQPQDQEIDQDQPEFVEETQPEAAPQPDSPPEEAAPLGTNIEGDGSDGFGLQGKGGGGMIGGLGTGNRQGGTKFGFYAGQVQTRVAQAMRSNKRTRSATLNLKVRIWVDSSGRVTRANLEGSSGNAAVDRAITDEVLSGLQLSQPPPEDMPMPIVMRISATKPN
ncbi:MAG: TonB family protein [Terrimicrobiaceae bacterium]